MRRGAARAFRKLIASKGFKLREFESARIGAAIGTGVHSGAAHVMNNKKDTGELGKIDDMINISADSFRKKIVHGVDYDGTTRNVNEADLQIGSISRMYYNLIAPKIEPIRIEKELPAKVSKDFELIGHPDCIAKDGIHDLKSGVKCYSYHAQMGAYRILARSNYIRGSDLGLRIVWIPRTKINSKRIIAQKPPQVIPYNPLGAENMAYSQLTLIMNQVREFENAGDPEAFPANPMSNLCSAKWCTALGTEFCGITK